MPCLTMCPSQFLKFNPSTRRKIMAKATSKRKPSAAFMKPLQPDEALAKIVGSKALPRTEVVKKIWVYIKKNELQDAKNRRMINADTALAGVFGKKSADMFE